MSNQNNRYAERLQYRIHYKVARDIRIMVTNVMYDDSLESDSDKLIEIHMALCEYESDREHEFLNYEQRGR